MKAVVAAQTKGHGHKSALGTAQLQRVGDTPLLRFERLARDLHGIQILGKAEWVNPGGSVKDRAAMRIVCEAEERGELGPGTRKTLLDATSGNTGIAYAMLGAARDFPVTLCVPGNVSLERKRILNAYGAQVIFSRWWLQRYNFGPVEWLWRTLMYGQLQPMKFSTAPA